MNKKVLFAGVLVFAVVSIAGCQQGQGEKSADQMISDGMKKLSEVKASAFDFSLKGDLKGPEGEKPEKVNFMLSMKGGSDLTNVKDPRLNVTINGQFNADQDGGNAEGEIRMNKDALFMNLMKLETKGAVQLPEEMKAQLVAQWWKLPIPPEAWEQLTKSLPSGNDADLTESQKKVKKAFENTQFFRDAKFVDMQSVMGEESYHYTAVLDKKALQDFIIASAEAEGTTLSESEKKDMASALEKLSFTGDVYVGKNSGVVNKVAGVFKLAGSSSEPSGEFQVEFSVGDINKAVNIEVPANTKDVPVEALMGMFLGSPALEAPVNSPEGTTPEISAPQK